MSANASPAAVATGQDGRSDRDQGPTSLPPCACGCGRPVAEYEGRPLKYATPKCRMILFELQHPRLDLSGLSPVQAKHAARMVEEAVRAAKLGQERATVDARAEVAHGRDGRPSCRVRLNEEAWDLLGLIALATGRSRSATVERLVCEEFRRAMPEEEP